MHFSTESPSQPFVRRGVAAIAALLPLLALPVSSRCGGASGVAPVQPSPVTVTGDVIKPQPVGGPPTRQVGSTPGPGARRSSNTPPKP